MMAAPVASVVLLEKPRRRSTPARVRSSRTRAAARQRALQRLAQEYVDRYRELYSEERQVAS